MSSSEVISLVELGWPEVQVAVERGTVVVVPVGSTEQHGKHLPLETDSRLSVEIAERSCRRAHADGTPVLLTPPLWLGYSPHHMEFAGTLTVDSATFVAIVVAVARSLWHHGFRKILFLNGHGGNSNLLSAAMQDLRFEHDVVALTANYWNFALPFIAEWRQSTSGGIGHACEMETALMLAVRAELVDMSKAEDTHWCPKSRFLSADLAIGAPVDINGSFADWSSSGSMGDSLKATAERGQVLLEALTHRIATFLGEFHGWDLDHPKSL